MEETKTSSKRAKTQAVAEDIVFNPLQNKRVIIKHVPKETALIHNPRHINYGGMSEEASRWFTVPLQRSGKLVDVLTKEEKTFLEEAMGLEYNALSVYRKVDNYWSNFFVRLRKQDNYLDLSNPEDYIKYKVLLANTERIAPSLDALQTKRKATYEFVILNEDEEAKASKKRVSANIQAYKELGKIESDFHKLRVIVEAATGKNMGVNTQPDVLSDRIDKLIQADAKLFLKIAQDPMLDTKVLLKRGIEAGAVLLKNGLFYTTDNTPMCDAGEATLSVAAAFINKPKNQALKMAIEAKIQEVDND